MLMRRPAVVRTPSQLTPTPTQYFDSCEKDRFFMALYSNVYIILTEMTIALRLVVLLGLKRIHTEIRCVDLT